MRRAPRPWARADVQRLEGVRAAVLGARRARGIKDPPFFKSNACPQPGNTCMGTELCAFAHGLEEAAYFNAFYLCRARERCRRPDCSQRHSRDELDPVQADAARGDGGEGLKAGEGLDRAQGEGQRRRLVRREGGGKVRWDWDRVLERGEEWRREQDQEEERLLEKDREWENGQVEGWDGGRDPERAMWREGDVERGRERDSPVGRDKGRDKGRERERERDRERDRGMAQEDPEPERERARDEVTERGRDREEDGDRYHDHERGHRSGRERDRELDRMSAERRGDGGRCDGIDRDRTRDGEWEDRHRDRNRGSEWSGDSRGDSHDRNYGRRYSKSPEDRDRRDERGESWQSGVARGARLRTDEQEQSREPADVPARADDGLDHAVEARGADDGTRRLAEGRRPPSVDAERERDCEAVSRGDSRARRERCSSRGNARSSVRDRGLGGRDREDERALRIPRRMYEWEDDIDVGRGAKRKKGVCLGGGGGDVDKGVSGDPRFGVRRADREGDRKESNSKRDDGWYSSPSEGSTVLSSDGGILGLKRSPPVGAPVEDPDQARVVENPVEQVEWSPSALETARIHVPHENIDYGGGPAAVGVQEILRTAGAYEAGQRSVIVRDPALDVWLDEPTTEDDWKALEEACLGEGGVDALAFKICRDALLSPVAGMKLADIDELGAAMGKIRISRDSNTREWVFAVEDIPESLLSPSADAGLPGGHVTGIERGLNLLRSMLDPFYRTHEDLEEERELRQVQEQHSRELAVEGNVPRGMTSLDYLSRIVELSDGEIVAGRIQNVSRALRIRPGITPEESAVQLNLQPGDPALHERSVLLDKTFLSTCHPAVRDAILQHF